MLGGGLVPGTLTVVLGATGIGKTQLAVQYAGARATAEGRRGLIFDMTARGDSQNHSDYAQRICNWQLETRSADQTVPLDSFFDNGRIDGDYLHVFDYGGRRVTKQDLEFEQWREWQAELNAKLRNAIAFFYGNFINGCHRVVVDGMEPSERPQESIQFQLFEYIYHQVLRKEPEWVARDFFRERYRQLASAAAQHPYSHNSISCLLLSTSKETMLDDLLTRPLDEGDALSNANTLVLMGKIRVGNRMRRALHIAKHRGSVCSEEIVPFEIDDAGLKLRAGA
jgi:KaiC/GvpD/RAD55 family RecA-like ATPase